MTSNQYLQDEHGYFRCDMCGFTTPHENKAKRHMVKSHGHEPYPDPPLLAEKWRLQQAETELESKPKPARKGRTSSAKKDGD